MSTISAGTTLTTALVQTGDTTGELVIKTDNGNTTAATFSTSGNLGLGVTPSAWTSTFKALQIKSSCLYSNNDNDTFLGANFYYNGTNNLYVNSSYATAYGQVDGTHAWYTAPSGTAGNAISFTQAMTLDASGNLGIGTSSPVGTLHLDTASGSASVFINSPSSTGAGSYVSLRKGGTAKFLMGVESTLGGTSDNGLLYVYGANALTIQTNGAERARISAAGGFSVGTTADPGAGAIYATGNITAYYSDDRLKTKLGGIENALDKVKSLSGFYYEANQTAQDLGYQAVREVGVSAQQVQAVLPEVVKPAPIDQQYLTVDYERLVPLLIEAIKELEEKVAKLEAK